MENQKQRKQLLPSVQGDTILPNRLRELSRRGVSGFTAAQGSPESHLDAPAYIEEHPNISTQYFKKLTGTDEIWEVRARHAGNNIRLLGFHDGPKLIILCNGLPKKSRKIPIHEIKLAENRRRRYLERKNNE